MKAIIPVAGIGTRLRPHTYVVPKVLLAVAGKPILGHILDELLNAGVKEFTFVVGYQAELVKQYINSQFHIKAEYVDQPERKGLGHAIWMTRELHRNDPEILIILGDTIFKADLPAMLKKQGNQLAVKEVEDPRRFGIAVLDKNKKFIADLEEKPDKPKSNLAIVGIYLIREPQLLYDCLTEIVEKDIKTKNEYQLTDGMRLMLQKGSKIEPFGIEGWLDCGKPETMLTTNQELLDMHFSKKVATHYETLYPGNILRSPIYIGTNAKVVNSIIGPHSSIGKETEIHNSIIENSIIGNKAYVKDIILKDSIIGNNAIVNGYKHQINIADSSEIKYQ